MGKGFDTFMDNPYWKRIYDEVPTDRLKDYYRIRYDASDFVNDEPVDVDEKLERLLLSSPAKALDRPVHSQMPGLRRHIHVRGRAAPC